MLLDKLEIFLQTPFDESTCPASKASVRGRLPKQGQI